MRVSARACALAAVLATVLLVGGCASSPLTSKSPVADAPALSSQEATAQAQAVLERFLSAVVAKDESRAEALLTLDRRGVSWGFDNVDRIVVGPITVPEARFLKMERARLAPNEVMIFRADITWFYKNGMGPANNGEPNPWMWILERQADGTWLVRDCGV